MSIELATFLMLGFLIAAVSAGLPFTFCLGGTALIFTFFLWGPNSLSIVSMTTLGVMTNFVLVAIPLFVFMAILFQRSGVADDLYELMYGLFGRVGGGLAVGTVIVCTVFAAMSGISAAATVPMALIALPSMIKRKYNKDIAIGSIAAGGALGILIPPSVSMILFGVVAGVSVGRLFAGGIFPGLLLSVLFCIYILLRCYLQPSMGPRLRYEEIPSWKEILSQTKALILPVATISFVLGSIFSGAATPTEAAALGALGAIISIVVNRSLTWKTITESCNETLKLTGMILWMIVCASWFASTYQAIGGPDFIKEIVGSLGVNRWMILIGIQFIFLFMGSVMETTGIIMLTTPIFMPIITSLGFDPVWFGILFAVNMEMGFLTPPFGYNLFYIKSVAPKDVSMLDIYRSILPFVLLQALGLIIVMCFPGIATYIPDLIFGKASP